MRLLFATNNKHKLEEVRRVIGDSFEIGSLEEINCREDIPETQDTIEGNASQKAFYVYDTYGVNCFADDTGLEIEALNGAPGVYSARYAGEACSFEDNMNKVLNEMAGRTNRKAVFKTVISLIINGTEHQFKGIIPGIITTEPRGKGGFGYDPVFLPNGYDKTFAEMDPDEKNKISHRGIASRKLAEFLHSL
jgi:XTP/dITP diphosphohydrolase